MSTEAATQDPPACERCGTRTYPTKRKMRMHQIHGGKAYPAGLGRARVALPVVRARDAARGAGLTLPERR